MKKRISRLDKLKLYNAHILDLRGTLPRGYTNRGRLIYDIIPKLKSPPRRKAELKNISRARVFVKRAVPPSLKILSFLLVAALNWVGLSSIGSTLSYYSNDEGTNNIFIAGLVDFTLEANPFDEKFTLPGLNNNSTTTEWGVEVVPNNTSNPFYYYASSTNFSGDLDFCNVVDVIATLEGEKMYSGSLIELLSSTTTAINTWTFEFSSDAVSLYGVCYFDIDFNGWQTRHGLLPLGGFNDTETITAKIGTPAQCDALSLGYWKNHEGCFKGKGSSIWAADINNLSSGYSGVYSTSTAEQICALLWIPNCGPGHIVQGKRCRARAHALANELDIVSRHLNLDAFIAGASDNSGAFRRQGLTSFSTVDESMDVIESVIANASSTKHELRDVLYIAARIYSFYENWNPFAPECVFDPDDVPKCVGFIGNINIENDNFSDVDNNVSTSTSTGGNSVSEGGDMETRNATSSTNTVNIINENIVDISGDATSNDDNRGTTTTCCSPLSAEPATGAEEIHNATTTEDFLEEEIVEEPATTTPDVLDDENATSSVSFASVAEVPDESARTTPESVPEPGLEPIIPEPEPAPEPAEILEE